MIAWWQIILLILKIKCLSLSKPYIIGAWLGYAMAGEWLVKWRWYISLSEDLRLWNSIKNYFPAELSCPCTFYCTCKHPVCLQYHVMLFRVAKVNLMQLGSNFWFIFFIINVTFWHSDPSQRKKERCSFKSNFYRKCNFKKPNPDSHMCVTEALWAVPDKLSVCDSTENTLCYFLYTLFVKLCLLTCYFLANY